MTTLTLKCLGAFDATLDEIPVTAFPTDKIRALLVYLALEPAQPHRREHLAALLWSELPHAHALTNLRVALHRLRKTLDDILPGSGAALILSTRQTIHLNAALVTVDVLDFQQLLSTTQAHAHQSLHRCEDCIARLTQCMSLYGGELLPGIGVVDAPIFEEWLSLQRSILHQQAVVSLKKLADACETNRDYEQAFAVATRLTDLDSYREDSHRQVMRLQAWRGFPDLALAQYAALRQLLRAELNAEPSSETADLAEKIRRGELQADAQPQRIDNGRFTEALNAQAAPIPATHDWHEMPVLPNFFGRTVELAQLHQWLVTERCSLVAILGIGGQGKTTLAAQLVPTIAAEFDLVIWRSLLNAPPLEDLLASLLPVLSAQQLSTLPDTLDQRLALFFSYLQQRRVLLVLDNMESILDSAAAGQYRPGYASYHQLLQGIVTRRHQGQMLLTSRERPYGVLRWERDTQRVHALRLTGLDESAGRQLLSSRGLIADINDKAALNRRYSGNPLALKLVSDTVQDLFSGDLREFLTEETPIFNDVRLILDEQFARLSKLEQEILFWLAIEREAIPLQTLQANFLHPPSRRSLLEALHSLQRRSLIEQHTGGFSLQNVITEYLTDCLVDTMREELHSGALSALHRFALLKAQTKESVRHSQKRLILAPIADGLGRFTDPSIASQHLKTILTALHSENGLKPSYAGGNLLNLAIHLHLDLADLDFSQLDIQQVDLRNVAAPNLNLAGSRLTNSLFTDTFRRIEAVALSPDIQVIAAAGDGGEIRLWRMADSHPLALLSGHDNTVTALAFSPDGRHLASTSVDETVRLWDARTFAPVAVLHGHSGVVRSVAFAPQVAVLASAGDDGIVQFWAVPSGCRLGSVTIPTGSLSIAFDPKGAFLAISSISQGVYLWDSAPLRPSAPASAWTQPDLPRLIGGNGESRYRSVAFDSHGEYLTAASWEGVIDIWARREWRHLGRMEGHEGRLHEIVFVPDTPLLVSGGEDQTLRIWEAPTRRLINTIFAGQDAIWSIAAGQDGQTIVSGGENALIRTWRVRGDDQVEPVQILNGYTDAVYALAFSPDGKELAAGGVHTNIHFWDVTAPHNGPVHTIPRQGRSSRSLAYSPDGCYLAGAGGDNFIQLWDRRHGYRFHRLDGHRGPTEHIAFHPDSTLLASGGEDEVILLWDVADPSRPRIMQSVTGHSGAITNLSFSPAGDVLASSSKDGTIRLWGTQDWREIACIQGDEGNWLAVHSPDGTMLACNGPNASIRLLDLTSDPPGKCIEQLTGHRLGLGPFTAAFSPDGRWLASGGADRTVHAWEVGDGKVHHVFTGHCQYIADVAFHPAGEILASGGYDGSTKLWSVTRGEALATLGIAGPYTGMNIAGVMGMSESQKVSLHALGAVTL